LGKVRALVFQASCLCERSATGESPASSHRAPDEAKAWRKSSQGQETAWRGTPAELVPRVSPQALRERTR
jgi:hypothetical protein